VRHLLISEPLLNSEKDTRCIAPKLSSD